MVIFRGINLEYFNKKNINESARDKLIETWKIDSDKKIILLPGRLTKWKGQELFIEALNILIEDYNKDNFQAIILGSDQGRSVYSKKLFNLVQRYQLNKKIKFISFCSEMPIAYSISDIVVSSSIQPEAFGRVAVESQAMEKPIIASDIGGSKETVVDGKSGFLFENNNPESLAENLNKLIETDKDKLQSIGNEGRKNILKKFDVEQMCYSTFLEYKKLIK